MRRYSKLVDEVTRFNKDQLSDFLKTLRKMDLIYSRHVYIDFEIMHDIAYDEVAQECREYSYVRDIGCVCNIACKMDDGEVVVDFI